MANTEYLRRFRKVRTAETAEHGEAQTFNMRHQPAEAESNEHDLLSWIPAVAIVRSIRKRHRRVGGMEK
jgi:hypothetical protein